jgi:hypothetical protein
MERMRGDSTLRRRMGDAARQRTTSMFLIDRYVREFEDTYASLLSRPASAWGWRRLRWPHAYNRWIGDAVRRRLPQAHP